jgi:hypothetical protein
MTAMLIFSLFGDVEDLEAITIGAEVSEVIDFLEDLRGNLLPFDILFSFLYVWSNFEGFIGESAWDYWSILLFSLSNFENGSAVYSNDI